METTKNEDLLNLLCKDDGQWQPPRCHDGTKRKVEERHSVAMEGAMEEARRNLHKLSGTYATLAKLTLIRALDFSY